MKKPAVSFLIPAYNDAATIRQSVLEASRVGKRYTSSFDITVINDASRDATGEILQRLRKKIPQLDVVTHTENHGYGATIKELYYRGKKEWLFSIPGDYQIGAMELVNLLPSLSAADMVIGWRVERKDPPERIRQSYIYNTLLRVLFGLMLHDVNSVRLLRRKILDDISLTSESAFVDAELAIKMKTTGKKVIEVPIGHRARGSQDGAGGGKWWTILPVVREMIGFRITTLV